MTSERALLIGSLVDDGGRLESAGTAGSVDVVEVRADLAGDLDPESLRRDFPGARLLYTLRSEAEGGQGPSRGHEREEKILGAVESYDLLDLEAERDLYPEILDRVPPERRIVSWHGPAATAERLEARAREMIQEPAWRYKLVVEAKRAGQGLAPLVMLRRLDRDDVVAFAAGEIGSWTRLLAPRLGAPVVYGALGQPAATGQLAVARLRRDFGLPELPPVRHLCGLVGHPASASLSPRLHNGIYRALGLEYLYLPFEVPVFGDFWLDVVESGSLEELGFPLTGLSVTAPFKEVALAVAGAASPLADRIGSANTLIHTGAVWEAESTDPAGVSGPLEARRIQLEGRRAIVFGAGGASRAAVFALGRAGAAVTLANRTPERGRRVARDLGIAFAEPEDVDPGAFDVLVNATPLGSSQALGTPFDPADARPDCVLVDLAYLADGPTPLVAAVRERGGQAIDGREALLHQALPQFRLMTEVAMPQDLAARILDLDHDSDRAAG